MSLSLDRAEEGRKALGEGNRRAVSVYQLSLLPGQALPGAGGVWGPGRRVGLSAMCPDAGLPISLSVCRHPSPTAPTPAQVLSKQLG